jgi:hypothetical protein
MLIAQVVGIVLVLVMGAMVNAGAHIGAVWLCFAISAVCIILIAVMSPSYKRLAQEKIAKEEADREAASRPTLLSPTTQADQTVLVDPAAQDAEDHRHHKHGHRKHKHRKRHQEDHDEDAMVSDEDLDQEQPATETRLQIGSVEIEEPVKEEKEAEKKKNRRHRKKQHEEEKNVGFDEQTVGGSTKIPQLVMVNSNEPGNQAHVAQDEYVLYLNEARARLLTSAEVSLLMLPTTFLCCSIFCYLTIVIIDHRANHACKSKI